MGPRWPFSSSTFNFEFDENKKIIKSQLADDNGQLTEGKESYELSGRCVTMAATSDMSTSSASLECWPSTFRRDDQI